MQKLAPFNWVCASAYPSMASGSEGIAWAEWQPA